MELNIRFEGAEYRYQAQLLNGTLWIHHGTRSFTVDAGGGSKSRKRSGLSGSSNEVVAPMPGKVTKILVEKGASVSIGDSVLVMEAMKMEYSLKAEIAGVVDQIDCHVGDQVALGKSLVKIQPLEAKKSE